MTQETALGAAFKHAIQTMSKRQQTELIAEHIYKKFDVFAKFKPLALGVEEELIAALPQFDAELIKRVMGNHCRRPKYLKSLARGGKRFDLKGKFKGEVSESEQQYALEQPNIREAIERQQAKIAEHRAKKAAQAATNTSTQPEKTAHTEEEVSS